MRHSVWIWRLQNEPIRGTEVLFLGTVCLVSTLKLLVLFVCSSLKDRGVKARLTAGNEKLLTELLWHLWKKKKKKSQFDSPAIRTLHSWLTMAHSSAAGFVFVLHTLLPSGEWRQMLQWIKAIWFWFASPSFFSLRLYNSSCTHTRNNRHSVNSWKGTASVRRSPLLYPPHTITVLTGDKSLGDGISQRLHRVAHLLWQVWVVNSVSSSGVGAAKITQLAAKEVLGDNNICARCRKGNCLCGK